jgi:hypothetical protein
VFEQGDHLLPREHRGEVIRQDGGAYGFDEGDRGAPGDEGAARRRRTWLYRRGAGASCRTRKKLQMESSRVERAVVGAGLDPQGP